MITARNTDIGALINAGAGGVPQELFQMAAVNKLRVYVAVPEVDAQAAQTGARATLTLDEFPGEKFTGTIVRNSDSIDLASRTLNVEVDIDIVYRAASKPGPMPSYTSRFRSLLAHPPNRSPSRLIRCCFGRKACGSAWFAMAG